MKSFLRIFAFLLSASSLLTAQEPKVDSAAINIFIEMQVVAIPREIAMPLVRDLMDKEKIEGAYLRIQELLEKKTAKLIGWPMVTTQSGERAMFEAIEEFRYVNDYSPGVIDFYSAEGKQPTDDALAKLTADVEKTQFNGVPSSFEQRNIGVTMEVEPKLSADGKLITLNIVPQHTTLKEMRKSTVEKEKTHEKIIVEQPTFNTLKTTTQFTLKSGERILMGVYPSSEFPDHLELFILRAEAKKIQ